MVEKINIKWLGLNKAKAQFSILAANIHSFKPALREISEQIYDEEKKIFSNQGSYDGRKSWKDLSDKYKVRKNKIAPGKSILRLKDRLYNQATSNNGVYELKDTSVKVGVDLPYARVHQKGYSSKNIPARPYLTFTDNQKNKWKNILDQYIINQAKKAGLNVIMLSR